jgi:ubiquinone/menaquinone biosynthesis C-methylase UbiE
MTDYDQTDIPAGYDRARDHGPEVLDLWMHTIATHLEGHSISRILDLGCGTGRFSEALSARFNAEVIGLDPSQKMLKLAREKQRDGRVHYRLGRAEAIPLPSEHVDVVFMSMSLHHFTDPIAAAQECRRVLQPNGRVFIRTGTRERIDSYPYTRFFASSRPEMEKVLPSLAGIRDTFAAAGLHMIASRIITQTIAPDWSVYAEKLAAGGDSVLAQLSRQDFDGGLAAVRRHAGTTEGHQAVVEPIDLFVLVPPEAPKRSVVANGVR